MSNDTAPVRAGEELGHRLPGRLSRRQVGEPRRTPGSRPVPRRPLEPHLLPQGRSPPGRPTRIRPAPPSAWARPSQGSRHVARVPRAQPGCASLPSGPARLRTLRRRVGDRRTVLRDGAAPGLDRAPRRSRELGVTDSYASRVSEAFIDCLAELHSIDIRRHGLDSLGRPDGFLERQVRGWSGRWDRASTTDLPEMTRLAGWLAARLPKSLPATVVHNDYKLDNLMLDPADPSRVNAVLDWE